MSSSAALSDHGRRSDSPRRLTGTQRREQLFRVALDLFAERGYRATTMEDIAEAAGVTKPLLYQHFSSKRALYLELADSVAADLLREVSIATRTAGGPRQQVELGFQAYFHKIVTNEAAFELLYDRDQSADEEFGEALRRVEDAMAEAIDPLIDAGLDDEHRRQLAYAVVGMAEGVGRYWIARRNKGDRTVEPELTAQRLAQRAADLAWAGLRTVHAD